MGHIAISAQDIHRLLDDTTHPGGDSYQQAFTRIAATHRGRPVAEILPLLRAAADRTPVGFTGTDLAEQADAISRGTRYELRVRVTG